MDDSFRLHMAVVVANAHDWIQDAALRKKKLMWAQTIRQYDAVSPPPAFKDAFDSLQRSRKELLKTRIDQKLANAPHFIANMALAGEVLKDNVYLRKMVAQCLKLHRIYIADLRKARETV